MHILIAGDLVPTQSNIELFANADLKNLLGKELLLLWNQVDIRIFNLEAPLIDVENPIRKHGPNLIAPTCAIHGIAALKPSLITLANNHILDQGVKGLNSTQGLLDQYKIPFVGAGENISTARKAAIIEKQGLKIGVYNCAEHEFGIAGKKSPGANPFDPLESLDHIQSLKNQCDYVIVIYHGGKEHYRYPSPYLQKVSRKMVEKGADLVVCQHSHCIGCCEKHQESTIVYGQGNFIFDDSDNIYWQTSLFIRIELSGLLNVEYIPFVKEKNHLAIPERQMRDEIVAAFKKRSMDILTEGFIENEYQKFADNNKWPYLTRISAMGKWFSRVDRRIFNNFYLKHKYRKSDLLAMRNYIECEAHRELLLAGLKEDCPIDKK